MFTNLGAKLGLWDAVAPPAASKSCGVDLAGWDAGEVTLEGAPKPAEGGFTRRMTPEEAEAIKRERDAARDAALAVAAAKAQLEEEERAEARGMFAKKQRAEYNDRVVSPDTWVSCQVVGVHLDDGPENPYYSITFKRERDGEVEDMEKQTQPERLRRLPKVAKEEVKVEEVEEVKAEEAKEAKEEVKVEEDQVEEDKVEEDKVEAKKEEAPEA